MQKSVLGRHQQVSIAVSTPCLSISARYTGRPCPGRFALHTCTSIKPLAIRRKTITMLATAHTQYPLWRHGCLAFLAQAFIPPHGGSLFGAGRWTIRP
jgi:hypothetical protein